MDDEAPPGRDARVFPLFERCDVPAPASARVGGRDAPRAPARAPGTQPRASKTRAIAANTLLSAWGQAPAPADERVAAPAPKARAPPAPIQRAVRGTSRSSAVHPFFARRASPPRASAPPSPGGPAAAAQDAPWPTCDMAHVAPAVRVPAPTCSWPRRARPLAPLVPPSGAALPPPRAASTSAAPDDVPRASCGAQCEAVLVPAADARPGLAALAPLRYLAADAPPVPADAPPVLRHLEARLAASEARALSHIPRASSHSQLWCDRWRPTCAAHCLDNETSADYLQSWLQDLRVTYRARPREIRTRVAPRRRTRSRYELDGEFAPDEAAWFDQFRADDEYVEPAPEAALTNCMVLEGPCGVGKSAAVYACAEALGFEVFEIYPGWGRRSGRELAGAVGQLTRNHMVRHEAHASATPRQSLILLDEADILFDDDAGFWPAVIELIGESRRPVVLTCTDAAALPLADLPVQKVLAWAAPRPAVAAAYLQLVALAEHCVVSRASMRRLYESTAPAPADIEPPSGPLRPGTSPFPVDRVGADGRPAHDLRAALLQLQWICLHTRAQDMLAPRAEPPRARAEPRGTSEHAALRRAAADAAALSAADLLAAPTEVRGPPDAVPRRGRRAAPARARERRGAAAPRARRVPAPRRAGAAPRAWRGARAAGRAAARAGARPRRRTVRWSRFSLQGGALARRARHARDPVPAAAGAAAPRGRRRRLCAVRALDPQLRRAPARVGRLAAGDAAVCAPRRGAAGRAVRARVAAVWARRDGGRAAPCILGR